MWTCPRCGRLFATRHQSHACTDLTEQEHLMGQTDLAISIYQRVLETLETCGEFRIHPQKSRIGFITRMTFGGVSLAKHWVDLSFLLPQPLDHPRIRKLHLYGPSSWGHSVRLHHPEDVDDEVADWLCQAMRRGDQDTLDPDAEVRPVVGRVLRLLQTAWRGTVEGLDGLPVVRLPKYIADALGPVDRVRVRVRGVECDTTLARRGNHTYVPVVSNIGLAYGDETDISLSVAGASDVVDHGPLGSQRRH
jgi:hypothetical protein